MSLLDTKDFKQLVNNNGYVDSVKFTVQDALTTANGPQVLGKIYTEVVQQAVEMDSVATRLVRKIRHDDIIGESTSFKWIGAGNIPNVDRGETGEYPEFNIQLGHSSTIRAQFRQRGLEVKISKEDVKYSRWDLIREHIVQAALALSRAKEQLVFQVFEGAGVTVFDNLDENAIASVKGPATGRDRLGNKNGSLTYEDLVDMLAVVRTNSYNPNILLMHPAALPVFQKDPILRNIGVRMGNPAAFLNSGLQGMNPYDNSTVSTWRAQQRAANGNASQLTDAEQALLSTATPNLPAYHPFAGLTIIASTLVPFDPINKTTSFILVDTNASAILNEQEALNVDSWDEPSRDLVVVRIKESYSVDVIDEGRGIAVAKNIPLAPNELFIDPQVVIQASDLAK